MVHADVHEGPWFPVHHRDQDLSPEQIGRGGSGRRDVADRYQYFSHPFPPSLSGGRRLDRSPIDPLLESRLSEDGVVAGQKGSLAQLRAEVARLRIGDHITWIVACAEVSSDELVQTEPLWARYLDDTVQRRSDSDLADRARDIIGRDRLDENRRQAHRVAIGCIVSDALDEFEELRGMDDRVRDRTAFDQLLLSELRAGVAALGAAFGSDDGQRNVMADACRGFGLEEIARRRSEEHQRRRVLERWGIGYVDNHGGSLEGSGQAFPGERVDARRRGRRLREVTLPAELLDELRSDEPRSADNDDLHRELPTLVPVSRASTPSRARNPRRPPTPGSRATGVVRRTP